MQCDVSDLWYILIIYRHRRPTLHKVFTVLLSLTPDYFLWDNARQFYYWIKS